MGADSRIAALLDFLREDPDDIFSRYALALEYIKAGNHELAFEQMTLIRRDHPDYLPNYYHFGKLYEATGKPEVAIELYTKGMEIARQQDNFQTLRELQSALQELTME
jgi:tetratricopeptide (TPR) repeat protein